MTTLLAGTSTTTSTTITTTARGELVYFNAPVGGKRHYVSRYAVRLPVRPVSVSMAGGCLLSPITRDAISLYLLEGLAHIYVMRVA